MRSFLGMIFFLALAGVRAQGNAGPMTPVDSAFGRDGAYVFLNQASMCMPKVNSETRYLLLDVLEYLERHPLASIEIRVHTDYRDSKENNESLSVTRAEILKEFLIENGLDSLRVTAVGVGELEPVIITGELKKNYYKFEVGKQLTAEYIKTFDPMWQEVANMLNRRTEIKLLTSHY